MTSGLDRISCFPGPRQELVEPVDGMSVDHALEYVGEVGVWFDVIEFGAFHEGADDRPAIAAAIASRKQMILAAKRNLPFILPMSGKKSRSITAGIHSTDAVFDSNTASSAPAAGLSTLRRHPA
jgi:hypothetical protein